MTHTVRRLGVTLMVLVGLLATLLAFQAPAQAAETGKVRGGIYGAHGTTPNVTMQWFSSDWTYLGKRSASQGSYSLTLKPGTYWIQFADKRPAYDVTKYAPTNIKVRVTAGHTTTTSVRMKRGAAIVGTVRAGGKVAGGARVVAANTAEQSFEVTANGRGEFALAGLPAGSYSVFTYDRSKRYVAKSLWVPRLKSGKVKTVAISLKKPAGRLLVDLYAGREQVRKSVTVTVVSKANGQFWSARSSHGSVSLQGLYPGRYTIVMPGVGNYFGKTGAVKGGKVRPGKVAFGSFRLTKRGAWVTGTVVDSTYPERKLAGATVTLKDRTNKVVASTLSNAAGKFTLEGLLTTQSGMKVVVGPGPDSKYLGKDPAVCAYINTPVSPVKIVTGRQTSLGAVGLRLEPGQGRAECVTPAAS